MYRIIIEQGEPAGAVHTLVQGDNLVGRSHQCAIRVGAADVSGQHLKIMIKGSQAAVENLSRYGTQVDGQEVQGRRVIQSGQRIALGRSTVLLFEEVAEAAVEEADTGGAPDQAELTGAAHGPATGAAPRTGAAPLTGAGPAAPEGEGLTSAGSWTGGGGGDEEGMTRAMQTRAAGQDEIEFLRASDRQHTRNRILVIVAGVLLLGLAVVLVFSKRPEPETIVSWPVDEAGDPLEAREESPLGGFNLVYPGVDDAEVQPSAGGITITCNLGRKHDLPVTIILEENVDDRHASETLEQSVQRWKDQMLSGEARCSIDAPLPMKLFAGEENGIPMQLMPYLRHDKGSWTGLASIIRNGRRFVVVRVEVPAADRARAEAILFTTFLEPTTAFVRSYWPGGPEDSSTPTSVILARAHEELRRLAPATWDEVEQQLVTALRKAVLAKNAADEKDALDMLIALRGKKALWYNEQLVQKEAALAQGDYDRVRRIAEMCKAVFSDLDDQRFYEVRKW